MNKKIKQFSEQAIYDNNGDTLHFLPSQGYLEKFSKLIIDECIAGFDKRIRTRYEGSQKDIDVGYGMEIVVQSIKDKFDIVD